MESEKRAKRPRIGVSNREGMTERYEKVEYKRGGGEEGRPSYGANTDRPHYSRSNYGEGGNRSYANERPNNYGNRQGGGYNQNRQGGYGNNRRNNYNNGPRYNQDYNRNNEGGEGYQQRPYGENERPYYPKQNRQGGYNRTVRADMATTGITRTGRSNAATRTTTAVRNASSMSCPRLILTNRFV